jgi:hypothetical protein
MGMNMLGISELIVKIVLKSIYSISSLLIGTGKIIYKLGVILTKKSLNALYYIFIGVAIVFILIKFIL